MRAWRPPMGMMAYVMYACTRCMDRWLVWYMAYRTRCGGTLRWAFKESTRNTHKKHVITRGMRHEECFVLMVKLIVVVCTQTMCKVNYALLHFESINSSLTQNDYHMLPQVGSARLEMCKLNKKFTRVVFAQCTGDWMPPGLAFQGVCGLF